MQSNQVEAKLVFINDYLGSNYRNLPLAEIAFFQYLIDHPGGGGGGGGPTNTDQLPEGLINKYFTNDRVQTLLTPYATLANPTFTGAPKAPTVSVADSSTNLATTAFVKAAITAAGGGGGPSITSTDELAEGSVNLYFTPTRVQAAVSALIADLQSQINGKAALSHTHPLSAITQSGASNGQVPSWNGTAWVPTTPSSGGGGDTTLISKSVPPGSIVYGYWAAAPEGYLIANGTNVSRTTYSDLWVAMGSPNSGDGSATFTLPDLRGEFIRGLDVSRGVDAGRSLGSSQSSQNLSHNHTGSTGSAGAHTHTITIQEAGSHTHPTPDATTNENGNLAYQSGSSFSGFTTTFVQRNTDAGGIHTHTANASSVSDHTHSLTIAANGGTEARPRNIALLACIKYTAATESTGTIPGGPTNTDGLPEGSSNLYFTPTRAQNALAASLTLKANITEVDSALALKANSSDLVGKANTTDVNTALALKANQADVDTALDGKSDVSHTHTLTQLTQSGATTGQVAQWNGSAWVAATVSGGGGSGPVDTDALPEGTTNLYFTDARAQTANSASLALKAPLASPSFTGTPVAPTATAGTNTTQIATTAYVVAATASVIPSDPFIKNTTATGTVNLVATANVFDLTLTGNTTLTAATPTPPSGKQATVVVRIRQGGTAYTLAWFSGISWLTTGGTAPSAPAVSKTTEYIFTYDATNGWIGRVGAST